MNRRKICIVTGSRAEYGILSGIMQSLNEDDRVELQIIATNMHLSPEYGMTVKEIESDGFKIDRKLEMLLSSDSPSGTVKSMGLASIGLADAFNELSPDIVVILGDRYEMLSVASAALIFRIPIAHIHGGEITEGAYDDAIRHAITKLSALHFTATEEYRKNVIQMGEMPSRVYCTGAPALENILNDDILSKEELEKGLGISLGDKYILVTFHPVTMTPHQDIEQIDALIMALAERPEDEKILFTLPNSDTGGKAIKDRIESFANNNSNRVFIFESLGRKRYYAALKHCKAVVGNSSSGIIEAPLFKIPTLNIGDRQKGRIMGNTVISVDADLNSIRSGLNNALSDDFSEFIKVHGSNPYYKPKSAAQIASVLIEHSLDDLNIKHFHHL